MKPLMPSPISDSRGLISQSKRQIRLFDVIAVPEHDIGTIEARRLNSNAVVRSDFANAFKCRVDYRIRSSKQRTASVLTALEKRRQPLELPRQSSGTFGAEIKGTPASAIPGREVITGAARDVRGAPMQNQ